MDDSSTILLVVVVVVYNTFTRERSLEYSGEKEKLKKEMSSRDFALVSSLTILPIAVFEDIKKGSTALRKTCD